MPAATIATAKDEILARLKAALDDSDFADWPVVYDSTADDTPAEEVDPATVPAGGGWFRAKVRHSDGFRASLGSIGSTHRHEMSGLVLVEVFAPHGAGSRAATNPAEVVLNSYRRGGATPSGVQFLSFRPIEIGRDRSWFKTNCLVDFSYDQIV